MNNSDDKIDKALQEWLESGAGKADIPPHHYDEGDTAAYRALFDALKEKPTVGIPVDFADNIVAHLEARRDRLMDFKWNFMLLLVVLLFAGAAYLLVLYIDDSYAGRMMQLLIRFKSYLAFAVACYFVLQYFDHRIHKKKIYPGKTLGHA